MYRLPSTAIDHFKIYILFIEWAQAMTKYMGDLLQKMIEYYGGGQSPIGPGFLTTGNQIDIENVNKQWAYCDRLSLHMYQVNP